MLVNSFYIHVEEAKLLFCNNKQMCVSYRLQKYLYWEQRGHGEEGKVCKSSWSTNLNSLTQKLDVYTKLTNPCS